MPSQQNLADSSSSLAFAIACHNNSGPQGHSIFIDLRNREVERVEKYKQDKDEKDQEQAKDCTKQAEEKSKAKFDELNQGTVLLHLTKWFKATKIRFFLLMSGRRAMEEYREKIVGEQEKEKEAEQEKTAIEGTKDKGRAQANAQVRESQREQARLQKSDPAELIKKVTMMWEKHCITITGKELDVESAGSRACEIFDVCAVSFFRNVRRPVLLPPTPPFPRHYFCSCIHLIVHRRFTLTFWTIPVLIAS